jgi:hypothetical protein
LGEKEEEVMQKKTLKTKKRTRHAQKRALKKVQTPLLTEATPERGQAHRTSGLL